MSLPFTDKFEPRARRALFYGPDHIKKQLVEFCVGGGSALVIPTTQYAIDTPNCKMWNELCNTKEKFDQAIQWVVENAEKNKIKTVVISDLNSPVERMKKEVLAKHGKEELKKCGGFGAGYLEVAALIEIDILKPIYKLERLGINTLMTGIEKIDETRDSSGNKVISTFNRVDMSPCMFKTFRNKMDEILYVNKGKVFSQPTDQFYASTTMTGMPQSFDFNWDSYVSIVKMYYAIGKDKKNG